MIPETLVCARCDVTWRSWLGPDCWYCGRPGTEKQTRLPDRCRVCEGMLTASSPCHFSEAPARHQRPWYRRRGVVRSFTQRLPTAP